MSHQIPIIKAQPASGARPGAYQTVYQHPPAEPEVGGREANLVAVECPYDGALNYIEIDPSKPRAFQCWKCGQVFYF